MRRLFMIVAILVGSLGTSLASFGQTSPSLQARPLVILIPLEGVQTNLLDFQLTPLAFTSLSLQMPRRLVFFKCEPSWFDSTLWVDIGGLLDRLRLGSFSTTAQCTARLREIQASAQNASTLAISVFDSHAEVSAQ